LIEVYPLLKVIIYNLDDKRNKDIITHINNNNVSLTQSWRNIKTLFSLGKRRFSTYITPLKRDSKMNPFILFNKDLLNNLSSITVKRIFVHDLDNSLFKFIHNFLLTKFDSDLIEVIQDKGNNYIYIKIFSLKFINSHRIFPISEIELRNLFLSFIKLNNSKYASSIIEIGKIAV